MDVEVQGLLNELTAVHKKARTTVEKLGETGIHWRPPASDTNQAAVIVTHMCGSEAQWIGEYAGGVPSDRSRESEFGSPQTTVKGLLTLLDKAEASSHAALSKHNSASLSKPAITGRADFKGTVRDCVLHALTHESEHVGHLELTLQLWLAKK